MNINCTLTPEEFVRDGKVFVFETRFAEDDTVISVKSQVKKKNDIYSLHIIGDYPRGSSVIISLNFPSSNFTYDQMYSIATKGMSEYIPMFICKDYPESLKKVKRIIKLETMVGLW